MMWTLESDKPSSSEPVKHVNRTKQRQQRRENKTLCSLRFLLFKSGRSALATIIARREACFSSEEFREMARIAVPHIHRDRDDAFLCLTQHSSCSIHSQIDVILRRRHAGGIFEQAIEMKFAQPRL